MLMQRCCEKLRYSRTLNNHTHRNLADMKGYKTLVLFSLLAILLGLTSCFETFGEVTFPEGETNGYKPIYANSEDLSIVFEATRPVDNAGKIYLYGDLILLNERFKGLHLIDNQDPSNPQNLGFLRISGATDMAVRNQVLYVNQYEDLLAVDVSDINNIRLIAREEKVLAIDGGNQVPPVSGFYFECVDLSKGTVIGWEMATINNPKCFY